MDSNHPIALKHVHRRRAWHETRRAEALERQRTQRQVSIDHARRLGDVGGLVEDNTPQGEHLEGAQRDEQTDSGFVRPLLGSEQQQGARAQQSMRDHFAGQLMQHEWMTDIPEDLGDNWLVLPRPEGQRCLVIASKGYTLSYSKKGVTVHRFPSLLPGGSPQTGGKTEAITVLDCIFSRENHAYIVMDIMCWAGYWLHDCKSEFRMYWLGSKLQELPHQGRCGQSSFGFLPVPFHTCDSGGLQAAYAGPVSFRRDGLLLLHREGHYDLGTSPLALLWKDGRSSRYFIETDAKGDVPAQQVVVLQCLPDGTLGTGDEPPCLLGLISEAFAQADISQLKPGMFVQLSIGMDGIHLDDGELISADLIPLGLANQRRGHADMSSKIVFQHMARHQPLTIDMLLASLSSTETGHEESMAEVTV